jgi:hypothetical protein
MMYRNRTANYDWLWHTKVWRTFFTWEALKLPKLVQLDKVLRKWFTALGGGGRQTNTQTLRLACDNWKI